MDACVIGNSVSFILVGPYSLHWGYKGKINKQKMCRDKPILKIKRYKHKN